MDTVLATAISGSLMICIAGVIVSLVDLPARRAVYALIAFAVAATLLTYLGVLL